MPYHDKSTCISAFTLTVVSLLFLLTPLASVACGFHSNQTLNSELPGTMHIVVRSHLAVRNGLIEEPTELRPEAAFQRAAWWLRLLTRKMKEEDFPASHLLLVDIPMWSQYQPDSLKPVLTLETNTPENNEPITLLTHASLSALASNTLSIEQALQKRLMVQLNH